MITHVSTDPFFFFNDTATTEIYTLSLHDALPISASKTRCLVSSLMLALSTLFKTKDTVVCDTPASSATRRLVTRSEEHTSELQSLTNIVCRLLLEKKKT